MVVESGRVSNLVRQFDEVDGPSQVLYVYIKHSFHSIKRDMFDYTFYKRQQ